MTMQKACLFPVETLCVRNYRLEIRVGAGLLTTISANKGGERGVVDLDGGYKNQNQRCPHKNSAPP
jgi:hypothetical protein